MNLTKLFNKNYFVQNILKSKAIMALLIGLIPILNAILLMSIESTTQGKTVVGLSDISILNIFGMYIIPVILSICFFGYLFNKRSVDFVNSMPLARKTIYITSSIGGILLIIAMMLINSLLLLIESLIFTNLIIPFNIIWSYFIVWTIAYILIFTVANIAASISGNKVTMLITTVVILLFIPFMHNYITSFNGTLNGSEYYVIDYDNMGKETLSLNWGADEIKEEVNYTLPYNIVSSLFKGKVNIYNTQTNVKMIILSVLYFIIGMKLFEKRKMEVNETSFKSDHSHMILKSLTLLIIGALSMTIMSETSTSMINLFIIGMIITYCIIYDIITTKSIRNIKLSIVYFAITALISVGLHYGVRYINSNTTNIDINIEEISSASLYINKVDYHRYSESKMSEVYLDNEELLKIITTSMSNPKPNKEHTVRIKIKLENDKKYDIYIYLDKEEYNKIIEIALNDSKYLNEYKNIDYSNVYLIEYGNLDITGEELEKELNEIKNIIDRADLTDVFYLPETYETVDLSVEVDQEIEIYSIPINISKELFEKYIEIHNKETMKYKNNLHYAEVVQIFNYYDETLEKTKKVEKNKTYNYLIEQINKNGNEKVDVTKPVMEINLQAIVLDKETNKTEYINLKYFTNNVLEYKNFVDMLTD